MKVPEIKRPIVRRVGRLVVRITAEGVELKGYRKQRGRFVTWAQVASLSTDADPVLRHAEEEAGLVQLLTMKAHPSEKVSTQRKPRKANP